MTGSQVIIQVGDLHFPEFVGATTSVDSHDKKAPGGLDVELGLPIPKAIRAALVEQIQVSPGAIVAVCGDITSKGDRDGFRRGLEYLHSVLKDPLIVPPLEPKQVHLVPGNHDVAFRGDQPFASYADLTRFEDLASECIAAGLGDILTRSHRSTSHPHPSGGGVSFVSVNSCRGTGANRGVLPGGGGDPLIQAATEGDETAVLIARAEALSPDQSLGEILDVPLLHPTELAALATEWHALDSKKLPVVLAHHGLLPQHTPRLNPYTEMANAGQARRALANLHRPVIYLHGHIHQHVVEVVDFPKEADVLPVHDRVVVVAAPELRDGFNKITVEFASSGEPIGLRIETFRIRGGEQVVTKDPGTVEVALSGRKALDKQQRRILGMLADSVAATGDEIAGEARSWSPSVSQPRVEAFLESMCWTGVLRRTTEASLPFLERGYML